MKKILKIGDSLPDGSLKIVDEDRLCYKVLSMSNGATGIRTISKDLLNEWVVAIPLYPNESSISIRQKISGKSNIDKFEYGYNATLYKLAQMILGNEPILSAATTSNQLFTYQRITYGAPGSGKSWTVRDEIKGESYIRTTFHPDSDYSTFVGAYKPFVEEDDYETVVTTGEKNPAGAISKKDGLVRQKRIAYKFVPQAFIKAYVKAWKFKADAAGGDAEKQFLVIEEINRGNCAQIFGDLFQLLDRTDNGFSDYEIAADDDLKVCLAKEFREIAEKNNVSAIDFGISADVAKQVLAGEVLLLPDNFYIWATMNTSDQSLFPIDSAFKRRWEWKYMPIYDAAKGYKIVVGSASYDWWQFLEKANALVQEFTDSEDKKLGYFFCKAGADGVVSLEQFVGKVVFYLWNDVFKDSGFDHSVFDDGNGGKLYFKAFFEPDGKPKAAAVEKLMANLGVAKVTVAAEESAEA